MIKDDSVNATFVDAGAGQFFFDEMSKERDSSSDDTSQPVVKRAKYVAKTLAAETSGSHVVGGALGPDWHEGIDVKGLAGLKHQFHILKIRYFRNGRMKFYSIEPRIVFDKGTR